MAIRISVTLLTAIGLFAVFGLNPFQLLREYSGWRPKIPEKKKTAGDFVRILEGNTKQNLIQRSLNDTKHSLTIIGQASKYKRTLRLAFLSGCGGAAVGMLVFFSPFLTIVLGIGLALIPLWLTNLSVYSYARNVNDELETALSMVTNAYIRHNDIVKAIKETIPQSNPPVKQVFTRFVSTVSFIDSNVESAIIRMKADLDNALFHQWCDILLLCHSDHTLKAGLQPIVSKFSELKAQQEENETQMMIPLQSVLQMVGIVCSGPPLLWLIQREWYQYLVHTIQGQVVLSVTAVIVFASIHKAIKLTKPIEYRL